MTAQIRARATETLRLLDAAHGPLEPPPQRSPLEELVMTILSQNTSDVNRDRAFASLRERFPTWEALADAAEPDVIDAIRSGGLANTKGPRILAVLGEIRAREGGLDLAWMRDAAEEEIVRYLVSLPGVGRKTAACVLAFSLRRDVCPVDTHVHRVAMRLGLIPEGTGPGPAHDAVSDVIAPGDRVRMHVALIRHGRETCKAARPRCADCPLRDLCPSAEDFLAEAG